MLITQIRLLQDLQANIEMQIEEAIQHLATTNPELPIHDLVVQIIGLQQIHQRIPIALLQIGVLQDLWPQQEVVLPIVLLQIGVLQDL